MSGKKTVYQGKFLKMVDNDTWEYVERTNCDGAVVIIAVNSENKVILIEQYRKALDRFIIEFPAGLISDSGEKEDVEVAGLRELEEETGYTAKEIKFISQGPIAPGLCTEINSFVLADKLEKISEGGGDESENIIVHEVPAADIENWLTDKEKSGLLIDIKIYAGLYFLKKHGRLP